MMRCRRSTFSQRPRRSAEGRPHDAVEVPNARRRYARGGHPRGAGDRAPDLSDPLAAQCLLPRAPSQSLGLLSRVAPRRGDRRLCRSLEDERRGTYHHRRRARQSTGQGVRPCPDGGADPARLPIGLALAHARGAAVQLYEKFGFKVIGRRRGYYTDNNEDAIVMWSDSIQAPGFKKRFNEILQTLEIEGLDTSTPQ